MNRRNVNQLAHMWDEGYLGTQQTRGCIGKRAYTAKKQASGVVRVMKARGEDVALGAYKCKICRYWHVGKGNSRRKG